MADMDEQYRATMKDIGLTEADFEAMRNAWNEASGMVEYAEISTDELLLIKAGFYTGYAAGRAH